MYSLFWQTKAFNQNISDWDTSKVEDMSYMFNGAEVFNQPLNSWDTSSVTDMNGMFKDAFEFNQDLTQWCVEKITSEPTTTYNNPVYDDEGTQTGTETVTDVFSENSKLSDENKPNWGESCDDDCIGFDQSSIDRFLSDNDPEENIETFCLNVALEDEDFIRLTKSCDGYPIEIEIAGLPEGISYNIERDETDDDYPEGVDVVYLSGTPTALGSSVIEITLTELSTDTRSFTVTGTFVIAEECEEEEDCSTFIFDFNTEEALVFASCASESFSESLYINGKDNSTCSDAEMLVDVTGLPSGLEFNYSTSSNTLDIYGGVSEPGTYTFTLKITNPGVPATETTPAVSPITEIVTGTLIISVCIDTVSPTITLLGYDEVTVTAIEARTAINSATTLPIYWMDPYITVQDDVDGIWNPILTETTLIVTSTIMFSGLDTPGLTIPVPAVNYNIPGIYTISYDATDSAGNKATRVTRVVTILADLTAPVITLLGDDEVTVTAIEARTAINSATTLPIYWMDPYITVQDDVDGIWNPILTETTLIVTSTIMFNGLDTPALTIPVPAVNYNIPGIYTISYDATDSAGNKATRVTRVVTILADLTAPVITLLGDDEVTVTDIEARTAINSATTLPIYWMDPYITVQDDVDGIWDPISTETTLIVTSTIMFSGLDTPGLTIPVPAVNYNIPGIYTISYDATDSAGNKATRVTRVVTILADLTAPMIIKGQVLNESMLSFTLNEPAFSSDGSPIEATDLSLSLSTGSATLKSQTPEGLEQEETTYTISFTITGTISEGQTISIGLVNPIQDALGNATSTFNINHVFELIPDSDQDGIPDDIDACPETPRGEAVNEEGCGFSQRDDDQDGVNNGIDVCPDTRRNVAVDEKGCSDLQNDLDQDGVPNDVDQCPKTETGAKVDANGCAQIQIDEDLDGVLNTVDLCQGTEAGAEVDINGCAQIQIDEDLDGVLNDDDKCLGSKPDVKVDLFGCARVQTDEDLDGVLNDDDKCPGTVIGESVDIFGCSLIQKDGDLDGVLNDDDLCPNSPLGTIVDKTGCSQQDLVILEENKDDDGDGVPNILDRCNDTPSDTEVDLNGCTLAELEAVADLDKDFDGVPDDIDSCLETERGLLVNEFGCSLSQIDTDFDRVMDDVDLCPDTPLNVQVDEFGCSDSQLENDLDLDGVINERRFVCGHSFWRSS